MSSEINAIPSNFKSIILDWLKDLSTTFPEYSYLWSKWENPYITESNFQQLYDYCLTVYPQRFFDILYQNNEIFNVSSETNTCFLPNVEFKLLFNCPNISETTRNTMWKYLQLVLFTVSGSIQDKAKFGDSANLFENLDETELHAKLQDAMTNMSDFFQNMSNKSNEPVNESNIPSTEPSMPDVDELHGHLKGLFDGKIGNLAKELAEEISEDMADILGKDGENVKSTADIFKNMMKNPSKITGLIKTVSDKLQNKMNSGEISQEELMKEATDILKNMKGMSGSGGGGTDFQEMFKNMAKGMAGMNIPKNAKIDTNALDRMTKQSSMREQMQYKMAQKQAREEAELLARQAALEEQKKNYKPYDFSLEETGKPNNRVFKIEGDTPQEKSSIIRPTTTDLVVVSESSGKKKKKNKK